MVSLYMCSFIQVYEKKAKDFPTPLRVRAEKSSKLINLTNKGRKHMATTFDIKKVPEATATLTTEKLNRYKAVSIMRKKKAD